METRVSLKYFVNGCRKLSFSIRNFISEKVIGYAWNYFGMITVFGEFSTFLMYLVLKINIL